jgi:PAP2 superfamily C-terminal
MIAADSPIMKWSSTWKKQSFIVQFVLTVLVLIFIVVTIPYFFDYVQHRNGKILNDPLLNLITPVNLSPVTFTLIYSSLLISIIYLFFHPERLLLLIQSYCLLTLFRVICMWLVALDNPPGLIVLQDPFTVMVGYGGTVITKDLFFSGHVSTMFLLFLSVDQVLLKKILLTSTLLIASFILIQHVHYTIDVLAAPFFSWLSVRTIQRIFKRR